MKKKLIIMLLLAFLSSMVGYSYWATNINQPTEESQSVNVMIGQGFMNNQVGDQFEVGGIDWVIVHIDENQNHLIMTVNVFGAGTGVHNGTNFVHLPETNRLRPALDNWWDNVDPLLQARALPTLGLDRDVRNQPGNWNASELASDGLTTPGIGRGTASDLFILSISEVNRFYGIGANPTTRIASGIRAGGSAMEPLIWWLRSPGSGIDGQGLGTGILATGGLNNDFYGSWRNGRADIGFRPAMWIQTII